MGEVCRDCQPSVAADPARGARGNLGLGHRKECRMLAPSSRNTWRHTSLFAALLLGAAVGGTAQGIRTEIHSFQSTTMTDQDFLTGRKEGKPVALAGVLRLPRPGTDRLPVVV